MAALAALCWSSGAAQAPDATSLRDGFRRAYDRSDWGSAIAIGERLAEALPGDPIPAYNLACAYARNGDTDRALEWLERSASRGFQRAGFMARDPDLAGLRSHPVYAAISAKVEANAARALDAFKARVDSAPVLVVQPSAALGDEWVPLPLIVMLHGYGSKIDDVAPTFRVLAERVGAVLAVPQAIEPAGSGYDWAELDHAEVLVMRAVETAQKRARVDRRRIVLAGFSQGASVAYGVGLRHPDVFAGVVAIAGAYDELATPIPSPRPKRMPRFAIMCGGADRGVDESRRAAQLLEGAGLHVRLRIYDGVGHRLPPDGLRELRDAVAFVLR